MNKCYLLVVLFLAGILSACGEEKQTQQVMMPRWLSSRVKDIWLMQYQLENYNPKKSKALIGNPRFRMAYDFLVLRSESIDKDLKAKAEYWTNIQK